MKILQLFLLAFGFAFGFAIAVWGSFDTEIIAKYRVAIAVAGVAFSYLIYQITLRFLKVQRIPYMLVGLGTSLIMYGSGAFQPLLSEIIKLAINISDAQSDFVSLLETIRKGVMIFQEENKFFMLFGFALCGMGVISLNTLAPTNPFTGNDTNASKKENLTTSHTLGFLSLVRGYFDYISCSKSRELILADYDKKTIGYNILNSLTVESKTMDISYSKWSSRPAEDPVIKRHTIISGLAGVGKTRYLNEVFKKSLPTSHLVIEIDGKEAFRAISRKDANSLWGHIYTQCISNFHETRKPLTEKGLFYALRKKKVIFILEDLHNSGTVKEFVEFINAYLGEYHGECRCVRILITTREKISHSLQPSPDLDLRDLKPLSSQEPSEFFIELCHVNKLNINISELGEALATAFSTPTMNTPLFIVICAWLVTLSSEPSKQAKRILSMQAPEVFEQFIEALFDRTEGNADDLDYLEFRKIYASIAHDHWPEWSNFVEKEMQGEITSKTSSGVTVASLVENGFMERKVSQIGLDRVSFPHQSMSDYLTARTMTDNLNYQRLQKMYSTTGIDGLVAHFASLIDNRDKLLSMAMYELSTCVSVLEENPSLITNPKMGDRGELINKLLEVASLWATNVAPRQIDESIWLRLGKILDPKARHWRSTLINHISNTKPSREGIIALSVISGDDDSLLTSWLEEKQTLFPSTVNISSVQEWLKKKLTDCKPMSSEGMIIIDVFLKSKIEGLEKYIINTIRQNQNNIGLASLEKLIELLKNNLYVLAKSFQSDLKRKQLNEILSTEKDFLIVFDGEYKLKQVTSAAKSVRINRPFTVATKNTVLENPTGDISKALYMLKRYTTQIKLMTNPQCDVVVEHYSSNNLSNTAGIIFSTDEDVYETCVMDNQNSLGLFKVVTRDREASNHESKTLIATNKNSLQHKTFVYKVAYREIKFL